MKKILLILVIALFPFSSFAEILYCTSNLTTKETPLEITELREEISDFRKDTNFTRQIPGTDFTYTVTAGLTKDIMDDPDEPMYVGKPTLVNLSIYNSSKSQVSTFSSPFLEVVRAINLTIGSAERSTAFRIHIACSLK